MRNIPVRRLPGIRRRGAKAHGKSLGSRRRGQRGGQEVPLVAINDIRDLRLYPVPSHPHGLDITGALHAVRGIRVLAQPDGMRDISVRRAPRIAIFQPAP